MRTKIIREKKMEDNSLQQIKDTLVGIRIELENLNKTLIEIKLVVDRSSKGRILPLIGRRNVS